MLPEDFGREEDRDRRFNQRGRDPGGRRPAELHAVEVADIRERGGNGAEIDENQQELLHRCCAQGYVRLGGTAQNDDRSQENRLLFTIQEDGLLTGFKGYFIAELVDGVVLDISGGDIEGRKTSDSWKHCYLPIEQAVEVRMGDIVEVTYRRHPPAPKDCRSASDCPGLAL